METDPELATAGERVNYVISLSDQTLLDNAAALERVAIRVKARHELMRRLAYKRGYREGLLKAAGYGEIFIDV